MDSALLAGIIGALAGVAATVAAPWVSDRLTQRRDASQRAEVRADAAQRVFDRYAEPLASAAFELQSRCFNILQMGLLQRYYTSGSESERQYAVNSTLWRFSQYLGWTELVRREIEFLNLGDVEKTRKLAALQVAVRRCLQADSVFPSAHFRIFADAQRAIGEKMVVESGDRSRCLGFAEFQEQLTQGLWSPWLDEVTEALGAHARSRDGAERLRALQHTLVDLVRFLDSEGKRFPEGELSLAGDSPEVAGPAGPFNVTLNRLPGTSKWLPPRDERFRC